MKNLYAAFLCILGMFSALTQSQANNFSGRADSVFSASVALDNFLAPPPLNDNFAGATDVTTSINAACTSAGTYTTAGATPDQSKGTCWSNGPNNNVWFKFTATATGFINVQVKVNGAGETLRNPFVAIFDASLTQVACQNFQGAAVDLSLSTLGLVAGNTYYIAVDNYAGYAGSFDLCLSDVPDYDFPVGAKNVTASINAGCTSGGLYTTQFATPDHAAGTCWSNGPNNNRWFKFTATATGFINVQVKVSGAGETLRNPFVAIFDASLTQVACQNYQGATTDLSLSSLGLIAGNTYYIAVDNYAGYAGSFDLCLSDVPDYDFPVGAKDVNSLINASCTTGGIYTTQFATPDHAAGTCWSNGPNNNRWFKFTATATGFINVQVKVSGAGETLRNPFVAIFDASLTQVACQNYQGATTDLSLSSLGLIAGNTYYIAVDNYAGYAGSFDLCLSDVPDYDFPVGAKDVNSLINTGCTSGGIYTTQFATPDHAAGTCWSNGPNNNRWFKFTATATGFINVQVKVSGAGETLRNPFVAIFDASLAQVACQNYQGATTDLSLSSLGLIAGNTYYIAVDNYAGYAGSFDLCLSDVPDYDFPVGAKNVTASINAGCTSGGLYTTQFATPDHAAGTCWSNGPNNNRWFKFTATATGFINVQVKVSGAGETLRNPFVAIFDASLTQVACQNYQGATTDLSLSSLGLIAGNTYYIAVDNYAGYAGSFDLCLTDVPDYDFPVGAKNVTALINAACTSGGLYTTQFATPDDAKGTCWSNGPNNNRWFKFTATASGYITVQVKVSGAGETLRNPFVAIYDAGLTQIACQNFQGAAVDECLGTSGLIPGNTYYISVDNYAGYAGSFDLCMSDGIPATISYAGSPFCATGTIAVTQTGQTGGVYSSTPGLSINAATGTINLAASAAGTYVVTYTISLANCVSTYTTTVTVNALPTAAISYAGSPYCATGTATVTQTGQGGGIYSAPAGVSITPATGAINLATSTPGIYLVSYTFSNGICSNTKTASITINALPTATISYTGSPFCATGTGTVTRTGQAGGTYAAVPAGLSINAGTGAINLAASTTGITYTVTYSFSGGGCSNTTTTSVLVNALPTVTITNPAAVCSPSTVDITAAAVTSGSTAGLTYTYFTNAAGTTVLVGPAAVAVSGTYYIKGTTASGCSTIQPVVVTINPKPTVVIVNPAAVCSPATVNLTLAAVTAGSTAGLTYTYFTDAAGTLVLAGPATVAVGGTYYIRGTLATGCSDIKPVVVTINPKPTVVITNPPVVCSPSAVDLTAAAVTAGSTAGLTYTYFTNAAGTTVLAGPAAVAVSGTYYIKGTTGAGCSDIQPVLVTINPKPTVVVTNPAAVCAPGTVNITIPAVTAGSTAGLSYTYFTDAAGTIALTTPAAVAAGGTYYIVGTTASGCSDIKPVIVTINPKPTVVITNPAGVCSPATVNLTLAAVTAGSTAGLTFTYFTDAAGTLTLATPAAVAVSGTFYIKGTTAAGCSDIQPVIVTINPKPTVVITNPAAVCAPGTVDLTAAAVTTGSTAGLIYTYFTDAAGTIVLVNANAVAASGTYYIKGTTASGCSDIKPVVVTINPKPTVVITNPAAVCAPTTVNLTLAAVIAGSTAGLTYTYFTDAAGTIVLANANAVAASGTYYIKGTTAAGCSDIQPVVVTINPKPTVVITNPTAVCAPGTVDLTAAAVTAGSTAGLTFTYFTDAAGTIVLANANAVAASGTYYVKGTTAPGCTDIKPVIVTINPKPSVVVTNPAAVCAPGTVDLTAAAVTSGSTAGLIYSYFTDAAGTIVLANANAVFASGTYYVKGTTAAGCSDIQPVIVTINPKPTVLITNPAAVCAPGTVDLTAAAITAGSTAGLTYSYFTDAAGTLVLANANVVAASGTYYIKGITASGCSDIKPVVVTINPKPTVVITNPAAVCAPGTVDLTAAAITAGSTAGLTYSYFTDAAGTLVLANANVVAASGTYYIKGITASGCSDIKPVVVTINPKPTVVITNPAAVCAPGTVDLTGAAVTTGSTAGLIYSYFTDAAGTIVLANANAVAVSGTYYIKGTLATGCSDIKPVVVTINLKPSVAITNPAAVCAPATVDLTAAAITTGSTVGLTYTYFTDAAGTIVLAAPASVAVSGTYYIKGTTASGCSDIQPVLVTINPKPTVVITNPAAVCAPGTVDLTAAAVTAASTAGLIYTYFTDAAGTLVLASPNAVATSGTYYIRGTLVSGCSDIKPVVVVINPKPTVLITNPAAACAPGTVDLTAAAVTAGSTAGLTYTYFTDAAGTVVLANANAVAISGTYYIIGTLATGCSDIKPVVVVINPKPTVLITNPAAVCTPGTVDLTASAVTAGSTAGLTFSYFTDAAGTIVLANANAVATGGTYYIKGTTASGCSDIKPVVVTINPKPTIIVTNPAAVCAPVTVDLTVAAVTAGSTVGLTYTYYTDAAGTIVLANANAVATSGTYYIRGTLATGCSDIQPVIVTINPKPTVTITNPAGVCAPGAADLTLAAVTAGSTAGLTFTYFTDAAGTIVLANANAVTTSGTYYIRGTTASGCSDIKPVIVTINPKPTVVTTNPAVVCAPGTVDLIAAAVTAGSTAGLTFTYFTDAAGTVVLANANAVAASGTYYIKGSTGSGCSEIKPVIVTVNPLPVATISYSGSPYCSTGIATVTRTGQAGGTYSAPAGVIIDGTTGDINLTTSTPGTYTVTYSFSNGTCSGTTPASITINALPVATITYAGSPYCATGTASITQTGQAGGTYTAAPAGLSINATTGAINLALSTPSATPYTVTYSFGNGVCSNATTTSILINALPTVTITNPASVCSPTTVDLTLAAVTAGSTAGLTFTYFTDAAGTLVLANANAVATSGTYYIKGTTVSGCSDIKPVVVTINPKPTVLITNPAAVCAPGTVDLTAAAVTSGSTAGLTYTYYTDAAGTLVLANANAVTASGTYYIKGTTASGCSDIKPVVVTINPKPTVLITNPAAVCAPGTVDLTAAAVTAGSTTGLTFTYFTDAAGTVVLANANAVAASGTYYIVGTLATGCSDIKPVVVTINPKPTVVITNPAAVCAPGTVDLTVAAVTSGSTAGLTFGYFTDAAGTIVLANANAVASGGTYYIKGTTASGCSDIKPVVVTINTKPTIVITNPAAVCAPGTVDLTAAAVTAGSTAGLTYTYFTDAAGTIVLAGPNAVAASGTYYIKGTTASGCSDIQPVIITINLKPTVIITNPAAVCAPGTVDLTATAVTAGSTAGLTFTYFTDAAGTLVLANANAVAASGTYFIKGTTASGCSDIKPVVVTINALPVATIAYSGTPYCATGTATVTQTGQTGGTFTAPAGVVINAATGDINLATSIPGTYTIIYAFSNGTCSSSTPTSITINALPTATISYTGSPYCATGTASVTQAGQTGGTYSSAPAGLSINAGTGAINLAASTTGITYTVTYTFTNGTCANSTTTTVLLNPLPTVTITNPAAACAPGTVDLTAAAVTAGSTAGLTFTYFTDASGTLVLAGPNAVATSGTYYIKGTTASGCSTIQPVVVTVNPKPTIVITNPAAVCAPGTVDLTAASVTAGSTAGLTFTYFTDAAGTLVLANANAVTTSGTYYIKGTTASGCSDIQPVIVTINPKPTVIITNPATVCAPGTVDLTAAAVIAGSTAGLTFTYFTDAAGTLVLANANAVAASGTYYIKGTTASGCSDIQPVVVTINPKPTVVITNPSAVCAPGTVDLNLAAVTAGSTVGLTYTYFTDAAGTIVLANANAVAATGTYYIKGSTASGCSDIQPVTVIINPLPVATIVYGGTPYCATGTATITQTGQTGGTYSSTPAGLSLNTVTGTVDLATSTPGLYSVTYSFANGTCSDTRSTPINIINSPIVVITDPAAACTPGTIDLTAAAITAGSTPGLTYTYYTDAAGTIVLAGANAVSVTGTYYIKGSAGSGCSDIKPVNVTINPKPSVVITNPASVCSPNTVDITNAVVTAGSTAGLTYTYFTDAAGSVVLPNANAVSVSGTYYIVGNTGSGCSDIKPVVVTINPLPTATIAYTASPYCTTGLANVTLTGQTGGAFTAPAAVSIDAVTGAINLAGSTPGIYTVTYSFSNGTCNNLTTASITINALPTATINYPGSPYCATGIAPVTQSGQAGGNYSSSAGLIIDPITGAINLASSTPSAIPYTITYTFTNGTCSNTTTASVLINALPTVSITNPAAVCSPTTVDITNPGVTSGSTAGLTYTYFTDAAGTIVLANANAVAANGTYYIKGTTASGCSDIQQVVVTVNPKPTIVITNPAAVCSPGIVDLTAAAITAGSTAGLTYTYFTDAAGTILLPNANAVAASGTYYIKGTTASGCSDIQPVIVTINPLPVATISYNGSPYCATGTAVVTQTGQTGGTFTAPAGVSINAATGDINLVASTPGTYTIIYSFSNGTCNNTTPASVTINALPTATIAYTGSPYCATGTATVTQTGQTGGTYSSTAGLVIDPVTGAINLTASSPSALPYTVTYTFTNGTCGNTTTATVLINALPTVTITNPAAVCTPGTVDLTAATVTAGSTAGLTYTYFTDAAGTIVLASANAVATSGTYYIKGTAVSGCSDIKPVVVTINAVPTAGIAYTGSPYCATGIATATQTGQAGGSYSAPAAVSINAITGAINLATSTPGSYTVTYSFSNGICSSTTTAPVTINALPTATINYAGSPYCATGTATVTQNGQTGGTYSSTAGLIIDPATGAIDLGASTANSYTVTYSFSNGICSNTTQTNVTILAVPVVSITNPPATCSPSTVDLTAVSLTAGSTAGLTFTYFTDAAGTIVLANANAVAAGGTYYIKGTSAAGCSDIEPVVVTINPKPTIVITNPAAICAPGTIDLTAAAVTSGSTAGLTYSYFTDAAGTIVLANANAVATSATYFIKGTAPSGCSDIEPVVVTINPKPAVVITNPAAVCAPGTVDITIAAVTAGSTAGLTYTYFADAAGTIVLANANAIATSGTYYIEGTTASGCSDIQPVVVTINALPTATISYAGSPYCATGTVTVTQTGQPGGTFSAPAAVSIDPVTGSINLSASIPGIYTITYTFSNGTCSSSASAPVTINALPTATINYPGSPYCATGIATVTQAGQTGGTYSAAPAGLSINSSTGAINLATSLPNVYTVTYNFSNGTCSNTTQTNVTVLALPVVVITNPGAVCSPGTVDLTNASITTGSTAGLTYTYFTDAAGTIVLANSNAVATGGTYYIKGTTAAGCSDIQQVIVTINPKPTLVITNPAAVCTPATVDITGPSVVAGSTAGLTYSYFTDAAGTIILANPNAVTASGTYYIMGTSASGCSDIQPVTVTINLLPTATVNYAGSPYCATGTATVTLTGQAGGTYSSTTGLNITAATGDIDLATSTAGTYTVTYTFSNGTCSNTTTTSVVINPLPTATIAYNASPYCATGTATVTQTGEAGGTYTAPAAVSINAVTGDINLATSTPGSYTITYSFSNGTCSNTTPASITINALPSATIAYTRSPYCANGIASVTQAGQIGGTYSSTTGLVIDAATGDIDLAGSTAGLYTVTYSFSNGTCSNSTTTSVRINALPAAIISYPGSPYCATGTATVTLTGQAGGTYSSTAGLVINAATGDIDLVASTAGPYVVTYTFSNGTCNNITTTNITITALPTIAITNPVPACIPSTVDITTAAVTAGSTAGLVYSYFTDAAGTLVLSNPNAITLSGTYYIRGTAASGCSNIQPVVVTINAKPAVVITNPGPVCAPSAVDITAAAITTGSTAGLTYSYFTDAAGTIVLAGPNAVTTGGTYYIKGTNVSGCSDIQPVIVIINAQPTATIAYTGTPYCTTGTATVSQAGQTGGFYSAPAAVSINAVTGDINLAASTPGIYTVTYTFSNGTCSNSTTASISINPLPSVSTTNPAAVCAPLTVNLTSPAVTAGSTPGLTFTYFSDPAGTVVLVNPATVSNPGTYYIRGTNGTGCSDIKPVIVTINPLPVANISYTGSPYCTNGTAIVSLTGVGGGTFASSPGLSLNAATGDINLSASSEGSYIVHYSFTNGTCSNSVMTLVTIKNPSLIVNNPAGTCFPATVDLTNPGVTAGSQSGLSYNYYQDNTGTIVLANPTAVGAGTYYLKGLDLATGCSSDIEPVVVTIFAKPTITASASDSDICKGTMITLTATSPGNAINWVGVGSGNVVTATPLDSTTYLAVATSANGCMDTAMVNISVKPFILTLTANPDPVLAGTNTTITTSGNFTYNVLSWSPDILFTDQTATTQNLVVNDTTKGFTVIAQSTDGCLDTATFDVVVNANLKDFFIPNSFSPNNDGNNDIFKVYGTSIRDVTLRVYNQWGELIFESENAQNGWDGTWKGRPQAVGVYVYVAQVTFYNNVKMKRKGTVNLIR